jgi:hypothetical protein
MYAMTKKRKRQPEEQSGPHSAKVGTRRKNYKSILFREAIGKTIASFEQIIMNEEGGWNLEIYFTDGTVMLFDMSARLEVRTQILKQKDGGLEPVRTYGKRTR